MATDLRSAVLWLTEYSIPWTLEEVCALSHATPSRAKAFCTALVSEGVLVLAEPGQWHVGPDVAAWRAKAQRMANDPKRRHGTYGNGAEYRARRKIEDQIKLRDWTARRDAAREGRLPFTDPEPEPSLTTAERIARDQTAADVSQAADIPSWQVTPERWYKTEDVAAILNFCPATIRRMISDGRMRAAKLNRRLRVPESEVQRWNQKLLDECDARA